jgi:hypothetical protein
MPYREFLQRKHIEYISSGVNVDMNRLNPLLYNWQKDIVRWAICKGKSALFEDCGLGKTFQSLEWSRLVCAAEKGKVIIYAPLAVATQTAREGDKFGYGVNICRRMSDVKDGINIANYEIMENFDPDAFAGIVLDESSILKHQTSATRRYLTEAYANTPYKLCCTATPSPNDYMELGNHSEFLGVMSRSEMLSTFFVHDGSETQKWRLKGHAEDKFWAWLASWACTLKTPADLGYEQDGYDLPPITVMEHQVKAKILQDGNQISFLPKASMTLTDRRNARRNSMSERVKLAADIANGINEQVLVWCDLNDESKLLTESINGAAEVKGSDTSAHKIDSMIGFSNGDVKCLVSKPSIAGWGMNWQNCSNMIFVGLSDSFEAYYQAVRRCYRFGQEHPVNVHIVISDAEGAVKQNIERKQADAERMTSELIKHTKDILAADVHRTVRISEAYTAEKPIAVPDWIRSEAV